METLVPVSIDVLDHGYCQVVDRWGSDEGIIAAARMSTDGGFRGWDKDQRLLSYLWKNKHHSPFEMGGLTVEVQAPISVFREWQRHRTQSYNELSARYTELPDVFYIPSVERLMAGKQSTKNKQGSEEGFSPSQAKAIQGDIEYASQTARVAYDDLLKAGVSRELARLVIPVNQYSRMRASANLRNWLGFLTLRLDESAQWEIRQYAEAVATIARGLFPRTLELFDEGRIDVGNE